MAKIKDTWCPQKRERRRSLLSLRGIANKRTDHSTE